MHFLAQCKVSGYFKIAHTVSLHQTKAKDFSFWLSCTLGMWDLWLVNNLVLLAQLPGRGRVTDQGGGQETRCLLPSVLGHERKGPFAPIETEYTWYSKVFSRFSASRNYTNVFVSKHVVRLAISKHTFLGPVIMLPSTFAFIVSLGMEQCPLHKRVVTFFPTYHRESRWPVLARGIMHGQNKWGWVWRANVCLTLEMAHIVFFFRGWRGGSVGQILSCNLVPELK